MSLPQTYSLPALHLNKYWLDVGCFRGDSIQQAFDAGFKEVFACDISKEQIEFCYDRFDLANDKDLPLFLYNLDSVSFLQRVLPKLDAPATIFLDAHWQLTGEKPDNAFPLMKELEVIMESDRTEDTIIIDDLLYMSHPEVTGWKRKDIITALRRINVDYKIKFVANPINENILIAVP